MTILLIISFMIFGAGKADKQLSIKTDSDNGLYKIRDVALVGDKIYLLDSGNGRVVIFSDKGRLLDTFSDMGEGEGELYNPSTMCIMNNGELWITDTDNGRVSVFKNRKFIRNIKIKSIDSPCDIIDMGSGVVVNNTTLKKKSELVALLDYSGNLLKYIKGGVSVSPKVDTFWNANSLIKLSDKSFLMGFKFYNILKKVEFGKNIKTLDMKDFYPHHKKKVKEGVFIPGGYCSTAFCKGPGNSVLIVKCDYKLKRCRKVLEFDIDRMRVKKETIFQSENSIRRLRYYEDRKILALVFGNDQVELYRY